MSPASKEMLRATTAMQVAVFEHDTEDVEAARLAIHAMIACKNRMAECIAEIKNEDRKAAAERRAGYQIYPR